MKICFPRRAERPRATRALQLNACVLDGGINEATGVVAFPLHPQHFGRRHRNRTRGIGRSLLNPRTIDLGTLGRAQVTATGHMQRKERPLTKRAAEQAPVMLCAHHIDRILRMFSLEVFEQMAIHMMTIRVLSLE